MPIHPHAGLLLSLEGIDGTGKSTLQQLLADALRALGHVVCCSREPTDGAAGQALRAAARAHRRLGPQRELELLLADRHAHLSERIWPALARGEVVLLDRYYHSTVAYQGAAGLDPQALLALNERFAPQPHLVVVLDLPLPQALARIGRRGASDAFEAHDNLARAKALFDALSGPHVLHLDAAQPPQHSLQRILELLHQRGLLDPAAIRPQPPLLPDVGSALPAHAPASVRNSAPILAVLRSELSGTESVLEIGSGLAQHACCFAAAMPGLRWQCSEQPLALAALQQGIAACSTVRLPPPLSLDAAAAWPALTVDVVYTANTLHIMPHTALDAFFAGAASVLRAGGKLLVYGPFHRHGQPTSAGNRDFDRQLRAEDPARGIRDVAELDALAARHGLRLGADIPLPAHNALRVWEQAPA